MPYLKELQKEIDNYPKGLNNLRYLMYLGYREHFDDKPAFAKAYATASVFKNVPVHIYDNDLIAGSIRGTADPDLSDELYKKADQIFFSYGFNHFITNADHFAPNYERFLSEGIPGLKKRVEASLERNKDRQDFLNCQLIVLDAFTEYVRRNAAAAGKKAEKAKGSIQKENLSKIAQDCEFLTDNAPKTFRQALQLIWLTHVAFSLEGKFAMAIGRLDKYLIKFLESDLKAGIMTREEGVELLACTFCKIKERKYFGGGDDVVNICIGGVYGDGSDAVNECSYMILQAVKECNIPGPNLSARLHKNMPDKFLDECLKVIGTGLGYPALMNDEINIPALYRHGYTIEDSRDYCFVGCIENFITGKQPPWSDGRFDVPMYLEHVFNRGRGIMKKDSICVDTGEIETCKSMAEFMERYETQLSFAASEYVACFNNENDRYNKINYPQPFLSLFCDDCVERGLDVNNGGAVYPSVHGAGCMGIATVADSLAAIEKYVFNEKKYTLKQLKDAIINNFEGYEAMRQDLLSAPKFGNDDDFVDKYAVWYVEFLDRVFGTKRTRDGGAIYTAIASNVNNIDSGRITAATPDGRKAGEPISDAASPMHGMDRSGVTAVVNSMTKPDYRLVSCGTVLNQKFSPSMFSVPEKRKKLSDLIRVYFDKGGQEIQINSVSREVLKDAMENPDKYMNLVVRVSGFSAYYVHLSREVQEDILKRTEHS